MPLDETDKTDCGIDEIVSNEIGVHRLYYLHQETENCMFEIQGRFNKMKDLSDFEKT